MKEIFFKIGLLIGERNLTMWNKLKLKLDDITPAQSIITFYFIAVTVSVLLLRIPAVHQKGVEISLLDTIFTAISSVSVTGLTRD